MKTYTITGCFWPDWWSPASQPHEIPVPDLTQPVNFVALKAEAAFDDESRQLFVNRELSKCNL
jgi:hypothetical protein